MTQGRGGSAPFAPAAVRKDTASSRLCNGPIREREYRGTGELGELQRTSSSARARDCVVEMSVSPPSFSSLTVGVALSGRGKLRSS